MIGAFTLDVRQPRVVFGPGSRATIAQELDRLGARRVLVIAGGHEEAAAAELEAALGDRAVARFGDIVQHVPVERAEAVRRLAREARADATVAFGGGSAIGFGKAVALELDVVQVAVPTTYAGSEMTPIWGLSEGGRKRTGVAHRVLPDAVVYDPELTLTLPPAVSGPSGMNALAHAVEALYGPGANPVTSLLAFEAVRVLHRSLPEVCSEPSDLFSRTEALFGAHLAASALAVAGTALHHKTCHVLGGMFGLSHADMNAVVLPHALRYNETAIAEQYARLAETLHADPAEALYDLARRIGAPAGLAQIGMPHDGLTEAAHRVVEEAAGNVRPPDVESVRSMLEDAFHGRPPAAAHAARTAASAATTEGNGRTGGT